MSRRVVLFGCKLGRVKEVEFNVDSSRLLYILASCDDTLKI